MRGVHVLRVDLHRMNDFEKMRAEKSRLQRGRTVDHIICASDLAMTNRKKQRTSGLSKFNHPPPSLHPPPRPSPLQGT